MKTLFASLLVALIIGTSSATFAADHTHKTQTLPASVSVEQIVKSKLDVVVDHEAGAPMRIRLLDASGRNLAARKLAPQQEATRVRFDLAALQDGVYWVQVSDGQHTQVTRFELKTTVPTAAAYQDLILL